MAEYGEMDGELVYKLGMEQIKRIKAMPESIPLARIERVSSDRHAVVPDVLDHERGIKVCLSDYDCVVVPAPVSRRAIL